MMSLRIGFDAKRYFHNSTGLGNYSRDIVRIISSHYPDTPLFLFASNFDSSKTHYKKNIQNFQNIQTIQPSSYFGEKIPSSWRSYGIVDELKRQNLDIYHGLSAELPLKRTKGTKYIVTIHDLIFMKYPEWYNPIDCWIYRKKLASACLLADHIVCISAQTLNDLTEFYPNIIDKTSVVYQSCHPIFQSNSVESQAINLDTERNSYPTLKNLPTKFALCVGSIEERKNTLRLIKAVEKTDELSILFIGSGKEYKNKMQQYVRDNNLLNRIFFVEGLSMEQVYKFYINACFTCYLSHYEGFGIPIIESLFTKKAVITNEKGVFREAAGDGGYYVDVNKIEEISNGLKTLWNNSKLCKELAEKGWTHIQQFSDKNIAENIWKVYQKAAHS